MEEESGKIIYQDRNNNLELLLAEYQYKMTDGCGCEESTTAQKIAYLKKLKSRLNLYENNKIRSLYKIDNTQT